MNNTAFIFDRYVTGKDFIGRKQELELLENLVFKGESVAVYDEPGTGKMSLIQQMLSKARMHGQNFILADVSFMKVRTVEDLLLSFASGVMKACAASPSAIRKIVEEYLGGTHLVFDEERFESFGETVSSNWMLDEIDIQKVFELPSALAARKQTRIVVLVREFQSILFPSESGNILKILEKIIERHDLNCPFIFTGSHLNAMKEIFDVKRWFWHRVYRFRLEQIKGEDIAYFIRKGFQPQGKVIEENLIINTAGILRNNMWYVNQLFCIVDSIAKGYVNDNAVDAAIESLLALHSPRFFSQVCSLTDFQLSLLKAVIDGETKFSTSSVIDRYNLNSSANVKRLKDALVKKEIVWFDDEDVPHVQDVLFEYWLRKVYFAR